MENNKKKIIILAIIIIAIIIGVKACGKNEENITKNNVSGGEFGLTVDPNAGEYVDQKKAETITKNVAILGWGSITIPANTKNVTVDFMNPEENKDFYYLTFELRLINDSEEGYEVLYKSGLVKPGLHVQNIELSRGLAAGEYEAVVHVQPYRMNEARTPTNNADMKTKLIVK